MHESYLPLDDYMDRSREDRRFHLRLETPCVEIGGSSPHFRALLAHHLGTTVSSKTRTCLCHACHNGGCSNPDHLYWGTYHDNHLDAVENGASTIRQRTIDKHGMDEYLRMLRERASLGGKKSGGLNRIDGDALASRRADVVDDMAEGVVWGRWERLADLWGVSHTQARRFVKNRMPDLFTSR